MNQSYSNTATETLLFPEMELQYAGFWERFGAAILDGLILMVPNLILQYMVGRYAAIPINLVIGWLYAALQESSPVQATLGKKALGLKVTTLNGDRITFGQATGRHFGKWISAIILFWGYLMMIWDDQKQTLHDKMASTLVVKQQ